MKLSGEELHYKLVNEYKIIGEKGIINFSLKDLTISIETKDTVGNLLQEWLKAWLMKEEVEFGENSTSISLPTSARYISATMLGTILKNGNSEKFIQGVYNFPTLDNPVWYVTEKDKSKIRLDDIIRIEKNK